MELVKTINKYLIDHYSLTLEGQPKFRVIWCDDLYEVRKGEFEKYTEGGIYLGTIRGEYQSRKYEYLRERWVLEVNTRAFPQAFDPSLKSLKAEVVHGDYFEPLRVFQRKNGEYLPPNMDVCKIICDKFVELINRPNAARLTESQSIATEKAEMDIEVEKFFDFLNQDDPFMAGQFRDGEAVIIHREDS